MWGANESPARAGTRNGAGSIEAQLSNLAAARARNQAALRAAFGLPDDQHAEHRIAALARRRIFARHGKVYVPLVDGLDTMHASLEVARAGDGPDDILAHMTADIRNGAAVEPGEVDPHVDCDTIGDLATSDRQINIACTVRDWLAAWRFAPSGLPDGRWTCWPGAILLVAFDDRTLARVARRIVGTDAVVNVLGAGRRQRSVASRLARLCKTPSPRIALAGAA